MKATQYHPADTSMPTIAPALPEDAPAILALQRLAYQSEAERYNDWSIPPLKQSLEDLQAEFAHAILLKAISDDGRLIGSVRARLRDDVCAIGRLIVHPDYQRQGIGSRLLAAIEAYFPNARCFELFTGSQSLDNLRLYERAGYRVTRSEALSAAVSITYLEKPA